MWMLGWHAMCLAMQNWRDTWCIVIYQWLKCVAIRMIADIYLALCTQKLVCLWMHMSKYTCHCYRQVLSYHLNNLCRTVRTQWERKCYSICMASEANAMKQMPWSKRYSNCMPSEATGYALFIFFIILSSEDDRQLVKITMKCTEQKVHFHNSTHEATSDVTR